MAYVTGNTGVTVSDDDVDDGSAILTSPVYDLTTYANPYVDYSRWFFNGGGSDTPNDSLSVYLNNGITTVRLEFAVFLTPGNSSWVHRSFKISDYITPTATMRLIVRTADDLDGHLVEAGFDKFLINEGPTGVNEYTNSSSLSVYPNPFGNEATVSYDLNGRLKSGASITVTDVTGRNIETVALTEAKGEIKISPSVNSGIYFLRIINGSEVIEPVKIVKMK